MKLKKLLGILLFAVLLSACAASTYRTARENANHVKNGMTLAEATRVIGMEPTHVTAEFVEWRRGNAQAYNGTPRGSIRFKLSEGIVTDVPEGGIFSDAAWKRLDAARELASARDAEAEALAAESDAQAAEAAAKKRAEVKVAEELQAKAEILAEAKAASASSVVCRDKTTCSKIFALAQIYASQNADQKIQVATDTIIETYNPTDGGKVGIAIVKMPRHGSTEIISITPNCREGEFNAYASLCRAKRTRIYAGFRPFIEASLAK